MAGENTTQDRRYLEFQEITGQIAASVGSPRFYLEKKEAVERSRCLFENNPVAQSLLISLKNREDYPGHGIVHITKVARDAGALIILDGPGVADVESLDRLVFLAHLAGILHDIRRSEPDHARRGAEAAVEILETLELQKSETEAIVQAIANHEAFQPAQALSRPGAQLLSDALYDGDKFRWGPDNFTETLWAIVITRRVEITALMKHFPRGLEATERIRGTFRTRTGKQYGPDFIDRALEIGNRIYDRFTDEK
jgi:hypothetical protein